jgi:hypothetical protein
MNGYETSKAKLYCLKGLNLKVLTQNTRKYQSTKIFVICFKIKVSIWTCPYFQNFKRLAHNKKESHWVN